jgi:hypothetical protein
VLPELALVIVMARFIMMAGAGEGDGDGFGAGEGDSLGEGEGEGLGDGDGELTGGAGQVLQDAWQRPPLTMAVLLQPGQ